IVGERRVVGTVRSSRNERERPVARRDRRQPPPTGVMNRNQNRLTVGGEARPIERSRLASRRERSHGTGTDVDEHQIAATGAATQRRGGRAIGRGIAFADVGPSRHPTYRPPLRIPDKEIRRVRSVANRDDPPDEETSVAKEPW